MLGTKDKDPQDVLDYEVDFTRWLPSTDTVLSAAINISLIDDDAAPLIEDRAADIADFEVRVWLSGGTAGNTYTVTVHAVTTEGREKDETFRVRVKES